MLMNQSFERGVFALDKQVLNNLFKIRTMGKTFFLVSSKRTEVLAKKLYHGHSDSAINWMINSPINLLKFLVLIE